MSAEYSTKSFTKEDVERKWYVVDANGKTLGRLASKVATLLRGKTSARFTPHNDTGDFVVVINAGKVKVTGKKSETKVYFHYTGYPGGATFVKYKELIEKKPETVIEHAVKGMLPKNRLGAQLFTKLKVYADSDHPHKAQKPTVIEL
ncbi:MAG: 50S ribosomal protein L13 [Bacteroidetes bacterium]|nr:50S ribosomal protein L13 [Bacteroidota bacterium]MCL5738355.1 50S ribosomal protein L13 [Bacteroidota bacterium]